MARQKLLTKEILSKVPPLYSQDGKGENAIAYAKFFNPCGIGTWYMSEYDPKQNLAFGKAILQETELGYFSLTELEAVKLPFGLSIERDIHFRPTPLKDCK